MFDFMVVAVLLSLTVVALTRFPHEGRSASGRFLVSRRTLDLHCPSCRAAVSTDEDRCVTCGQAFVIDDQTVSVNR